MHNMACQKRVQSLPINIKSGKKLPNGKTLSILSCFLFLFDENKDRVLVSAKNNSGAKIH